MQVEKAMFALTLVLICVLAGAAGQILWKEGMSNLGRINGIGDLLQVKTVWDIFTNKYIILGIFLYAMSVFLWLGAMSTLDVSFMYPLLSLGYIVTAILAMVFIGENITLLRWAGIVMIIAGCFMITKS
ncbi:MAG: EamA family transporter [Methanotrichaceae archaeon]|jgi:drug/metabolite transporter (DMT)-like permease